MIESIPWKPHAGQKKGVKFLLEHAAAGLFADPGTGKSSMVLAAFKMLKKRGLAKKMLIVAPLRPCHLVWPYEINKWQDFNDIRFTVLHGPKKNEALFQDADVYIINPDGLDWLLGATHVRNTRGRSAVTVDIAAFRKHGFDTLVVDELTMMKNTQSNRHKSIRAVRHTFKRIWGLTGSPAPNGLLDLFGQALILDGGIAFGKFITHYRTKYFVPSFDGFSWNLRKGSEDEIYVRMKPLVLRLAASDYIDMPQLIENIIPFKLPPAIQKVYNGLEDDLIAKYDDNILVATNAAAASTKLRQVVNGAVYVDEEVSPFLPPKTRKERGWIKLHDDKISLLISLIDELQGQPVLVAYDFHHDLERIRERLGQHFDGAEIPFIGGGTTTKRAEELEGKWNRGELPVLLGHPQSIGHGLNLQHSTNHICFFAPIWNLELRDQFVARVWRQGSKFARVFVHYLVAKGTIDEKILYVLKTKNKSQNALLEALREIKESRRRKNVA